MTKRKKGLIYGKGVVDIDYQYQIFEVVNGKRKLVWICPYYDTWKQMLRRVFSEKLHEKFPTYRGCTVDEDWLSLTCFKGWMEKQEWCHKNKKLQLDKDFLIKGNKRYGPDTCCFVTHNVNSFCKSKPSFAEDLPLGVYRVTLRPSGNTTFCASCLDPLGKNPRHIGYFATPDEAHEAWRSKKEEYANLLAESELVTDERIKSVLKEMYKKENWYV